MDELMPTMNRATVRMIVMVGPGKRRRNDRSRQLCRQRWPFAGLLHRRFCRPVEKRAAAVAAACGGGPRGALFRLGAASGARFPGGAARSARPRPLAGPTDGSAADARTA